MDSKAMKILGVAGAACIAAISLAGCSSSPQASTTTTKPTSSSGSTPSLPKTVPDNPSLRHDVNMSTCQVITGGWEAGGTAKNSGTSTKTYLITVYFTDTQATVVGYAQTHVKVAPGQSAQWTASSKFAAPSQTRCVLSGVG
jgi:hypothetical protein